MRVPASVACQSEFLPVGRVFGEIAPWNSLQGLLQMGIRGVTVSDVRGYGAQGGSTERYEGISSSCRCGAYTNAKC